MEVYKISKELSAAVEKRDDAKLTVDDLTYALEEANKAGKPADKLATKLAAAQAKLDGVLAQMDSINARLEDSGKRIAALRQECLGMEGYDEYEADHSEGIDLARLNYGEMRKLRSDLQLIFQDPYSSLNPRMTVSEAIAAPLLVQKTWRSADGPLLL